MVGIVVFALLTSLPLCPGRERSLVGTIEGGSGRRRGKTPHPFFLLLFFRPAKPNPGSQKKEGEKKKNVSPPPSAPLLSDDKETRVRCGVLNVVLKFEPKNSFKTPRMRGDI
jgi:hypothetical protein